MHFLELTVLLQPAVALPREGSTVLLPQCGSNFLLSPGRAVLPLRCGTSAEQYYRDEARYYQADECVGGYDSGRGVPTPHTHSLVSLPTSLSLLLKNDAGGPRRLSVSGHSPRIPIGWIVPHHLLLPWTKVFPQIPLFLGCSLASRFLGRCLLFLRFSVKTCKSRM